MRTAALDFGKVRIGLAVADELGKLAHPRPYLDGRDLPKVLGKLVAFAKEENIGRFIVGLPAGLDGKEGPPARRARRFARMLKDRTGCRVELMHEWLSTREANARLREQGLDARASRQRVDSAAAAILLQAWLDRPKRPRTSIEPAVEESEDEDASE